MTNFEYYAPTKVVFGKETEKKVGELICELECKKVLVHFGGKSAKESGLIDKVCDSLKESKIEYELLGGVVPNPRLSKVKEGIALCKEKGIDFILAVGGGSVIDSAKGIAMGVLYDGDVWDFYEKKLAPGKALPVGAVLTIAAAGSEMSSSSVITNEDGDIKRGCSNNYYRPKFAIMNPEYTMSLPKYQTFAGIADIMMHTMERYFSRSKDHSMMTDSIAIGLLKTVIHNARILLKNPNDYNARAEIMWAGSLSHNDLTGHSSNGDWSVHQLEHELSGMFDVTHGAGLTAIWSTWARYVYQEDIERFSNFAISVFDISSTYKEKNEYSHISFQPVSEDLAEKGISSMENFFKEIGMPIRIHELTENPNVKITWSEEIIKELARKASFDGKRTLGAIKTLEVEDMENIYRKAW